MQQPFRGCTVALIHWDVILFQKAANCYRLEDGIMENHRFMNPIEDIEALKSRDIEVQIHAIRNIAKFLKTAVDKAVAALKSSDNPVFIAESLFLFGSIALVPLETTFLELPSGDLKVIVAALLVQLGSKTGIGTLFEAIREGNEHQHLAVSSLAKANVREACPVIIEWLDCVQRDVYTKDVNAPFIHTFLIALETLQCPLPSHLKLRFTAPGVPRSLSQFIK